MTPERYQQVKKVFLAAIELDETVREAFVREACAGDDEIREEVQSLLKHHNPQTLFLEPERVRAARRPRPPGPQTPSSAPGLGEEPRFPSGEILADRYRIVGLLGRGGMGEVYRADDLKLGQPVALKLLSGGRADDPVWRERFYNEVRLARRVTHPNVNRIHDLGEADGELFISMEYVDGEDLASLLRRIGRLSRDKGVEIARQLCAGLGAAHDQGVLHRDLKPANVMIDGQGRVRITDFGIAALVADEKHEIAGTPAYMAPEVLEGQPASVSSDIYSLGLILYELMTGTEAFERKPDSGTIRSVTPTPPSTFINDVDPALERMVLRCLDREPKQRPASAYAVLAALPGGDPLAAALAAGQTPSPDLVAAAGITAQWHPVRAIALCVSTAVALIAVVLLADKTFLLSQAGLAKPPAVLADRAQQIMSALGYDHNPRGGRYGFFLERIDPVDDRGRGRSDRSPAVPQRASPVVFRYIHSQQPVMPRTIVKYWERVEQLPPPGMQTIDLDPVGHLVRLFTVPNDRDTHKAQLPPAWSQVFELAGLRYDRFEPVSPEFVPPVYADDRAEWRVPDRDSDQGVLGVKAASLAGRVHYVDITRSAHAGQSDDDIAAATHFYIPTLNARLLVLFLSLAGGLLLARRNLRLARGDLRGARRIACFSFGLILFMWAVSDQHVPHFTAESVSIITALATATFGAGLIWVYYMAIEPYVRRLWPQTMITWSRVLTARLRDPFIGRDILIGVAFGVSLVLVTELSIVLPSWTGWAGVRHIVPANPHELRLLIGFRHGLSTIAEAMLFGIWFGMALLILMLLFRVLLRSPWLATAVFCAVMAVILTLGSAQPHAATAWIMNTVIAGLIATALVRAGLLAVIVGGFVHSMITNTAITADLHSWRFEPTAFTLSLIIFLMAVALHLSRVAKPLRQTSP